ncbi:MAG: glycoside hydrolase family 3 protein [Treponema sp.]|nr:glycoside hydrolase family 3 protein [Treponema sp.]
MFHIIRTGIDLLLTKAHATGRASRTRRFGLSNLPPACAFALCGLLCALPAVAAPSASGTTEIPETADFWSDYPAEPLADFLTAHLSDEELLAQMFMFGWKWQEEGRSGDAEPTPLLNQWVTQRGLGSVKVFGWNTDDTAQVARAVAYLQQESQSRRYKIPLFVATDQEGGWIRHVRGDTTTTPGNMAIGASAYPMDAYYSAYYISREIAALGINMNFAPTVDLYTDRQSSVIGPRSFGEDPQFVGELGASFVAGSLAAGVIPTAKHFPGHGDTSADSHGKAIEIRIDRQTLENRELVPFKYLIAEHVPAIMSAHLRFPLITGNEPASLSKTFLTDILRNELHYEGLIITDDMQMNGATSYAMVSDACTLAIQAGNDIILSSETAGWNERLWTKNLDLMRTNTAFRNTVKKAARRVILYKLNYFRSKTAAPLYPDLNALPSRIPDREGQAFFLSQACRSITAYKRGTALPFKPAEGERILIAGHQEHPEFFAEAEKRFGKVAHFPYKADMGPYHGLWVHDNLIPLARSYDTIIVCVDCQNNVDALRELQYTGKRIIVMSIQSPVPAMSMTWADTVLFGYSYSPYTFKALFAALCGDFDPAGALPLN